VIKISYRARYGIVEATESYCDGIGTNDGETCIIYFVGHSELLGRRPRQNRARSVDGSLTTSPYTRNGPFF